MFTRFLNINLKTIELELIEFEKVQNKAPDLYFLLFYGT